MTQEEKQLLLKDLCARLPYDVKGRVYAETTNGEYDINGDMIFFNSPFDVILDDINTSTEEIHVVAIGNEDTVDFIEEQQAWGDPYTIDDFKPYLRPMSSMTEEELKELNEKYGNIAYFFIQEPPYYYGLQAQHPDIGSIEISEFSEIYDWLNAHHFDYRGLIEKGLALEAKEGMYE